MSVRIFTVWVAELGLSILSEFFFFVYVVIVKSVGEKIEDTISTSGCCGGAM